MQNLAEMAEHLGNMGKIARRVGHQKRFRPVQGNQQLHRDPETLGAGFERIYFKCFSLGYCLCSTHCFCGTMTKVLVSHLTTLIRPNGLGVRQQP